MMNKKLARHPEPSDSEGEGSRRPACRLGRDSSGRTPQNDEGGIKVSKIIISFLLSTLTFLLFTSNSYAARLYFDPVTKTTPAGQSFQVQVGIDTAGDKATTTDAVISFNSALINVVSITPGTFFPSSYQNITGNKIKIGGSVTDVLDTRTGTGILGTMTLQGTSIGSTSLSFDCTPGSATDSNVTTNAPTTTDVINCSQLVSSSYTFTSGGISGTPTPTLIGGITPTATPSGTLSTPTPTRTPTPSPTPTPTRTPTPTPAKVPVTGQTTPGLLLLLFGVTIITVGFLSFKKL